MIFGLSNLATNSGACRHNLKDCSPSVFLLLLKIRQLLPGFGCLLLLKAVLRLRHLYVCGGRFKNFPIASLFSQQLVEPEARTFKLSLIRGASHHQLRAAFFVVAAPRIRPACFEINFGQTLAQVARLRLNPVATVHSSCVCGLHLLDRGPALDQHPRAVRIDSDRIAPEAERALEGPQHPGGHVGRG